MIEITSHSIRSRVITCMKERNPVLNIQIGGNGASTVVYIYLLNVPSFSSRYFNKIKRTSRLGRLLALSLEILYYAVSDDEMLALRISIFKRKKNIFSVNTSNSL